MRALTPGRGAVLLLVLALMIVAVGCGDGKGASADTVAGVSAEQLVEDSVARMETVDSASFVADLSLQFKGDAGKMTDPTAQALLSQGVTVHAEGSIGGDPTAADVSTSLGIAGLDLEFGLMADGDKRWIEYQGVWYVLDAKDAKAMDDQTQSGGTPTEQLKGMGLDPSGWGTEYELVGTETLEGVEVYHVRAVADPQKLADSLMKAVEDPKLRQQLDESGGLGQLGQGLLTPDEKQTEELAESLEDATVDFWIGIDEPYMYKARFAASVDASDQEGLEGASGMALQGTVTMSAFDEPVEVEAPKKAKSFEKFMEQLLEQLFGGMLGGEKDMLF